MKLNFNFQIILFSLVLIGCSYFAFVHKTSKLPIRHCDEGRMAVQAMEMNINGNLLLSTIEGEPDDWNTKPQLTQWIQYTSIKLFGPHELSIRLVSLLSGFMILFLLIIWGKNLGYPPTVGIFAGIIFTTTGATTYHIHSFRTGDPDALLSVFLFSSIIGFYKFIHGKKGEFLWLYFFIICFTLATMTKGIQAFMFAPALLIYGLYIDSSKIFNKKSILLILLSLGIIVTYYLLREHYHPGFLKLVWQNELGGRFLSPLEGNEQKNFFYFKNLFSYRMTYWGIILSTLIILSLLRLRKHVVANYLLLISISYMVLISIGKTKLEWYDLAIFPILSLLTSILLYDLFELRFKDRLQVKVIKTVSTLLLIVITITPAYSTITRLNKSTEIIEFHEYFYRICYFLRDQEQLELIEKYRPKIIHGGPNGMYEHVYFYYLQLKMKGTDISWGRVTDIEVGDTIIVHQDGVDNDIASKFEIEPLFSQENIRFWKIINAK